MIVVNPTHEQLLVAPVGATCLTITGKRWRMQAGGGWCMVAANGGIRRNVPARASIDLAPIAVELRTEDEP